MATVSDVLNIAAKHLGIHPVSQAPTGADYLTIEAEYNGLMHELSASHDLLDTAGAAYTHTDQTTGDTFELGDRFVTGLGAMVAKRTHYLGAGLRDKDATEEAAARGYGLISGAFSKTVTQDAGILRRNRFYY